LLPFGQEFFFSPFAKYIETKIYGMIILLVVVYGCETWSIILTTEHSLRIREYMILRKMFGSKWSGLRLNCDVKGVMIYTSHQILLQWSSQLG
jgi:hypothetical protein